MTVVCVPYFLDSRTLDKPPTEEQEKTGGSEAGSYLRLKDFVYHSTLGLRLRKKKKKRSRPDRVAEICRDVHVYEAPTRNLLQGFKIRV